jgi:WhiB family redox-sensing transcriptional regulator
MDTNLFHPGAENAKAITRDAQQVCARCEVRGECLEFALEHEEAHGIWGGLTPRGRARLLSERRRNL